MGKLKVSQSFGSMEAVSLAVLAFTRKGENGKKFLTHQWFIDFGVKFRYNCRWSAKFYQNLVIEVGDLFLACNLRRSHAHRWSNFLQATQTVETWQWSNYYVLSFYDNVVTLFRMHFVHLLYKHTNKTGMKTELKSTVAVIFKTHAKTTHKWRERRAN